jgi:hypothetical protein
MRSQFLAAKAMKTAIDKRFLSPVTRATRTAKFDVSR